MSIRYTYNRRISGFCELSCFVLSFFFFFYFPGKQVAIWLAVMLLYFQREVIYWEGKLKELN